MPVVTLVAIGILLSASVRTNAGEVDTTAPALTKNPTTATLLSIALPGLGQYYNEQYWKIPLFTGTWGVSLGLFFYNNANFNTADADYNAALANHADVNTLQVLLNRREAYRDNRDISGVVVLASYVLSAIDAYVGAHLFDFDVSDDVSFGLLPDARSLAAMRLQVRW